MTPKITKLYILSNLIKKTHTPRPHPPGQTLSVRYSGVPVIHCEVLL